MNAEEIVNRLSSLLRYDLDDGAMDTYKYGPYFKVEDVCAVLGLECKPIGENFTYLREISVPKE